MGSEQSRAATCVHTHNLLLCTTGCFGAHTAHCTVDCRVHGACTGAALTVGVPHTPAAVIGRHGGYTPIPVEGEVGHRPLLVHMCVYTPHKHHGTVRGWMGQTV